MDTLQGDIDALEREKTELRERVKELSRKTLMEGIVRQSSAGLIIVIFIIIIIIVVIFVLVRWILRQSRPNKAGLKCPCVDERTDIRPSTIFL